jgi:ring-1,2-phenylacetyl-CoA epoxidase subunit PaaE
MSKNTFYPLSVSEIRPETDSAVCITFDVPDEFKEEFRFVQGQHLTLKKVIKGEEVRRSYSICSGVDEGKLQIGVKKIEGGLFSTFANSELKVHDTIEVMPPRGEFYTSLDASNAKKYLCICAGSGITPILSIVKSILSCEPLSSVTIVYGNQMSSTVMFKNELGFLKNRYMARLNWLNILSREQQDAKVLFGRIDNKKGGELNRANLIDIVNTDEFFLCGPESMISEVSKGLRDLGIDESKIHYELFFSSPEDAKAAIVKHNDRAKRLAGRVSEIDVKVGGRSIHFDLLAGGENILDGALRHGADLPFSCKAGDCATCKARLLKGEVEMDLNHSLTAQEVKDGFILTCQSHPVSEHVVVDFDQI